MSTIKRGDVFSLAGLGRNPVGFWLRPPIEYLIGLRELTREYLQVPENLGPLEFLETSFERLEVDIEIPPGDLDKVPAEGPAVVVANHPFGGIEGLAIALLLLTVRQDIRILANFLLGRIPELRELFLLVDPFEGDDAAQRSLSGLRAAHRWLEEGGLLVVFPAGEVAHLDLSERGVVDPPWTPTVARLVRRAQCPVVPFFFSGHNGPLFQLAGMLHSSLRTVMLPRQLLARRGSTLHVRVGKALPFSALKGHETDRDLVRSLRRHTEILAERSPRRHEPVQPRRTPTHAEDLIPAVAPERIESEIAALGEDRMLASSGKQAAWVAAADEIPDTLLEIGRLRELTFRDVGEGTGRELDLDRYDEVYEHLFIWNSADRKVVGAYRIGRTEERIADGGLSGLYTSSLFRYNRKLFENMGPALEMGRSFIQPDYQRSFAGLLLLWKGIGQYVVRNPEHATLFGPVSISADYKSSSQQLLAAFLKQNSFTHPWSKWVRPRSPFRERPSRVIRRGLVDLKDVEEASRFISEIESDDKGMPILLRQYLKLGGRLLGFNVDPDFSNVLDALVMVDLRETPAKTLFRYMGEENAPGFLGRHGIEIG